MLNNLKHAEPKAEALMVRAERVAAIAASHADAVDAEARFPEEAEAALKAENLFGVLVPASLGGEEANVSDVADVCYRLGRACSSTGMIYAMHQVKAACIVHHGMESGWHDDFMRRMATDQLLVASSTTEGGGGGNVRSFGGPDRAFRRIASACRATPASFPTAPRPTRWSPPPGAPRTPMVPTRCWSVFEKKNYTLEKTGGWDTLGMRGTCSAGFSLKAVGRPDQILPVPYGIIHAQSMVPTSHLLWSGVWCGVAAGAVERARKFMRKAARAGADLPPGMPHFTRSLAALRSLRALIAQSLERYESAARRSRGAGRGGFPDRNQSLKVDASELAVETVMAAMRATGLSGYRNDSDVSASAARCATFSPRRS